MEHEPSWDDLRVLLAVHRTRTLLAAGKLLGLSTSTTGRRLDALEASVGRKLVSRSRSGTEVERDALKLVRLAEDLEHGLGVVRREAHAAAAGTIKVSVPEGAVPEVAEALLAFRREYPDTDVELVGENKLSDIAKREADIGLRTGRSSSSVLIERRAGVVSIGLYASAAYAERHLPSRRLRKSDAGRLTFIGLDSRWRELPIERWMRSLGAVRFPFRSSSVVANVAAVARGEGLAALVEQVGQAAGLVRIDTELPGPTQPMYLVYHRELRRDPRIKAVVASMHGYLRR